MFKRFFIRNEVGLFMSWVILLVILTADWNRGVFVNGSVFWSLENQMRIEKRPYTKPEDVSAGIVGPNYRSTVNKLLEPTLRELHRYCDGQCFYAGSGSLSGSAVTCDNEKYECELTASIAMHNEDSSGDMYCDIYGTDNLRESFCRNSEAQQNYRSQSQKSDIFYTITLHRVLGSPNTWGLNDLFAMPLPSCRKKWDDKTGRRCRKTEFVAIAFVENAASSTPRLNPQDLWYVCTADEPSRSRVSMWYGISDPPGTPIRIVDTKPHHGSGMGVVFSKVIFDEDKISMGCQFVIQESNMTLDISNPPANAAFFGKNAQIKVKLASGYVQRDENDDTVLTPFYTGYSTNGIFKLFMENEIKPSNQIDFSSLNVDLEIDPSASQTNINLNIVNLDKIKSVLKMCDNPGQFPALYIACYPPNTQLNCVHTGRCPVMFIVEVPRTIPVNFDTIKAHIYSFLPDDKGLRKTSLRPMGFAAVAFSSDDGMGRDVVITCHANGMTNMSVHVSINFGKANIFPGKISYDNLIFNTEATGTAESNQILCSFEMNTIFLVNMFLYEPDYRQIIRIGESEKLEYDFKTKEVFLLTSAGNRNYPNGKIVFHDFRQVLQERFSKDLFLKKAGACNIIAEHDIKTITFALLFLHLILL